MQIEYALCTGNVPKLDVQLDFAFIRGGVVLAAFGGRNEIERSGKLQRNVMEGNVALAAGKEDWEKVRRLVEQGGNVNDVDDTWYRKTALHYAAIYGNSDICSFLLSQGTNVSQTDEDGNTPLHFAAYYHHVDTCQLLVDHKDDVTSVNNKGQTPFHLTLASDQGTRASPALITNESVNVADRHGNRALHIAARNGDIQIVKLLVDCGADLKHNAKIDAVDKGGNQPLHLAVRKGHTRTSRLLLSHDADVNSLNEDGQTPLHTAAGGDKDLDKERNSPLHLAVRKGHTRTSRLLVSREADVNSLNEDGQTPLHTAAGGDKDCPELCSILLEHNAKIDAVDKDGNQPLHLAVRKGHTITSRLLLSRDADVNSLNEDGQTPLHTAAGGDKDCPELCSILLEHNAKIDAVDKDGNQPLHLACKRLNSKSKQVLLDHNADANVLNNKKCKPWHLASQQLTSSYTKAIDGNGNNALYKAAESADLHTVQLLVDWTADVNEM
ncbi:serine/threonine-protein phosphatase 6 regulatory ankyrin repeat subunit B-like [Corticium candelabrum]|uniref:serine/threonine-protein phosphatase 6 regulatory ankyrin repeat subunit B-like n=1 Tax=Corticium candelabrum TaxID=121492 RepID=UPI002E266A8B|nr:serine/threonine-protein phosphatase 6 regulatory ankyrin repeat subunit B-like [Corticium candelabrum]